MILTRTVFSCCHDNRTIRPTEGLGHIPQLCLRHTVSMGDNGQHKRTDGATVDGGPLLKRDLNITCRSRVS